ncbi:hypothetical protein CNMCM6457_001567 [Aspergillus fumigatiaffinis]|nr:hypothetical protein CNMCM6457_001567 [Aspergillus fumigatiaffinis]
MSQVSGSNKGKVPTRNPPTNTPDSDDDEDVGASAPISSVSGPKLPKAEPFDGTQSQLQGFLTQMNMHLDANKAKLPGQADKVIFIATHLQGQAWNWFKPYIQEYYEKQPDEWSTITRNIFTSYAGFRRYLEQTFGDIDAEATAERRLKQLRQTTLASTYFSEFYQLISNVDWNEKAYISTAISGLKDHVRDELARMEQLERLNQLAEIAVTDDSEDSIKPMKDENAHQTHMDQGLWSWMQPNRHFPKRKENGDDATSSEFCATKRGAYDTTGAITPKKRSNKRLRKLFKECTTLDDDEIEQELLEEDSTEYRSAKSDWPTEDPSVLVATNHDSPDSNGYSSIKWENITPEELVHKWTTLTDNEINQTIGSDKRKTDHGEPDQEDFPAIDWTTIDRPINPLDKEYGTQWVSLNPKKEQPHEIPKTPQDNSPKNDDEADRYAAWLQ